MLRYFRVAANLCVRLEEQGVSVPAVLRAARLPYDLFEQKRILVTTEELFALWRSIAEVSKDASIGLHLGNQTRLERFHPMSIAALSTETFGAAIHHMARYKKLSAPEEIVDEMRGDEWEIQFRWLRAVECEPHVLVEYCFASVLAIARKGSGVAISPLRVELVQERSNVKELRRHFGCTIVCGSPRNALIFRVSDAELPFVTRNAELLDMLAPQLEQELQQRTPSGENSLVELVRGAIQQRLTGHRPSIEDIARDLHMSARSLQRKLQDSGSTFQRLLEDARHEMARYYLSNSILELTEAAYLLGYEDANSFARAFRRREGVPPRDWREAHRSTVVH